MLEEAKITILTILILVILLGSRYKCNANYCFIKDQLTLEYSRTHLTFTTNVSLEVMEVTIHYKDVHSLMLVIKGKPFISR